MDYIQIVEWIAALVALCYLYFEVKASVWCWRIGIVLPLFYIFISWQSKVYGNIAVNLYYLVTSIWGLWEWSRSSRAEVEQQELGIRRLYGKPLGRSWQRIGIGVALAVLPFVLMPFFKYVVNSPAPIYLLDAFATAMGMVGMVLLAKKYLENWYCWIGSNLLYSVAFFLQGYYVTAIFFVIYTLMAIWGYRRWYRICLANESSKQKR